MTLLYVSKWRKFWWKIEGAIDRATPVICVVLLSVLTTALALVFTFGIAEILNSF